MLCPEFSDIQLKVQGNREKTPTRKFKVTGNRTKKQRHYSSATSMNFVQYCLHLATVFESPTGYALKAKSNILLINPEGHLLVHYLLPRVIDFLISFIECDNDANSSPIL